MLFFFVGNEYNEPLLLSNTAGGANNVDNPDETGTACYIFTGTLLIIAIFVALIVRPKDTNKPDDEPRRVDHTKGGFRFYQ